MPDWQPRQQYAFDLLKLNGYKLIIAKDHIYKSGEKNTKQYATFKDADFLCDYIFQQPANNRCFYEIVHEDTPLKSASSRMCMDSELEFHKLLTNGPYKQGALRFNCVNSLFIVLQEVLRAECNRDLNMDELFVVDASTPVIISFHVLLPFRFANDEERKSFKLAISAAKNDCFSPEDLAWAGEQLTVKDGADETDLLTIVFLAKTTSCG